MLPLFKTHASIGKSILRIEDVKRISDQNKLDEVYFVEDTMVSFPEAFRVFGEKLRFGYRFFVFNDDESEDSKSRMVVFASGDDGCKELYDLYTRSFNEKLKNPWDDYKNLKFVVPFYDSFLHKNLVSFSNCMPSIPDKINFFVEQNNLPFDQFIEEGVKRCVASSPKRKIIKSKSIYYEKKEDIEAFQTYKVACNRQMGRNFDLSNPNLEAFGSDCFCIEDWEK